MWLPLLNFVPQPTTMHVYIASEATRDVWFISVAAIRYICEEHLLKWALYCVERESKQLTRCVVRVWMWCTDVMQLLYAETPSNPLMTVLDVESFAQLASCSDDDGTASSDRLTVVDATLASPQLLKPINYGVDIVIHSALVLSVTKSTAAHILQSNISRPIRQLALFKCSYVHLRRWFRPAKGITKYLEIGMVFGG